jgi:site-specific DNA-methyltransferase (adenine-specific)
MKPTIETDQYTLYLADCLDVLPTLEGVDAVVTDPPFNVVNRSSSGLRNLDRKSADSLPVDASSLAASIASVVSGSAYVFCGTEQVSDLRRAFVDAGMSTRQGVWEKTNPSPMNGERLWLSSVELCVFARHPKAPFNEFCASPVWRGPTEPRGDHPTAKPDWLMRRLISASCAPNSLILDPFMGSGTTGVAAIELGHRFVGIEIDEDYFSIAAKRIAHAASQRRLFT